MVANKLLATIAPGTILLKNIWRYMFPGFWGAKFK